MSQRTPVLLVSRLSVRELLLLWTLWASCVPFACGMVAQVPEGWYVRSPVQLLIYPSEFTWHLILARTSGR